MLRLRSLAPIVVSMLVMSVGCGDDKGDTDGSTDGSGTAGSATEGSTTDSPTTEPTGDPTAAPEGMYCQDACEVDADCQEQGMDFGFKCALQRCKPEATDGCMDDLDCQVQLSGWSTVCATQADCPGQVCIDVGGAGRCATPPSDFVMCTTFNQVEVSLARFPEGDPVTVCSNTDYECGADGACVNPCMSDADCTQSAGFPVCNVGTGICECGGDDDCGMLGVPALSVCHAGVCGCGTDADCTGMNIDVCNENGACGCSSAAVCTQPGFDGTTPVCEGL